MVKWYWKSTQKIERENGSSLEGCPLSPLQSDHKHMSIQAGSLGERTAVIVLPVSPNSVVIALHPKSVKIFKNFCVPYLKAQGRKIWQAYSGWQSDKSPNVCKNWGPWAYRGKNVGSKLFFAPPPKILGAECRNFDIRWSGPCPLATCKISWKSYMLNSRYFWKCMVGRAQIYHQNIL